MDTSDSFDAAFDAACAFPYLTFAHLHSYVATVDQFLQLADDLQMKSIRDALAAEVDPVAMGELNHELKHRGEEGATATRRLIWGGLLVSIYAAFEDGIDQIFEHYRAANNGSRFKAKGREDLLSAAARYSSDSLGLQLFANANERAQLDQLRELRRSFVHGGGRLDSLSPVTLSAIQAELARCPLEVVGDRWCADAFVALHYLKTVAGVSRRFGSQVFGKMHIPPNSAS